jgi:hypothetical protein
MEAHLNAVPQWALAAKVALGEFRTVWDSIQSVEDRWFAAAGYPAPSDTRATQGPFRLFDIFPYSFLST